MVPISLTTRERTHGNGIGDPVELLQLLMPHSGGMGELPLSRQASERRLQLLGCAMHQIHLRTSPARKWIEPAQLVEDRTAHPREAVGAYLRLRAVEAPECLDKGNLACTGKVLARDVAREPPLYGRDDDVHERQYIRYLFGIIRTGLLGIHWSVVSKDSGRKR